MITAQTEIRTFPDWVEYRNHTAHGTQVITVYLQLYTPRVSSSVEWSEDGGRVQQPLPLPIDEILEFSYDALRRTQRNPASLDRLIEGLCHRPSGQG